MAGHGLYVLLLVSLTLHVVFCKHDYFDYYYSKYHKVSSTTEAVSSTSDGSTDVTSSSTSLDDDGDDGSFEKVSSPEDRYKHTSQAHTKVQHGDTQNDEAKYMFIAKIGIIVGSVVLFILCLGCIVCCCPYCCNGTRRRGLILRDNRQERGTEVHPEPLIAPTPQQPMPVQHIPPQYMQEPAQQFPMPYDPYLVQPHPQYSPMHPGYQYSPTSMQYSNPPEAPPPYEASAPPIKY